MKHNATKRGAWLRTLLPALAALICSTASAMGLEGRIDSLLAGRKMTVGVAAECGDFSYSRNDSVRFPLMSVFKVHVAMTVIARLEMDGRSIDSVVHVPAERLLPATYSPLRDKLGGRGTDITIRELMRYSVAESDNNACDILIDIAGGIDYVDMYIRSLGVSGFSLTETEASMHADPASCRNNWSTPSSTIDVLKKAFETNDKMFSPLRDIMLSTMTGQDKIRGGVSEGIPVAHKTGSSDRTGGIKTADNDAGVIMLPEGRCYIAVFIMDSAESDAENAATIAEITREILAETITVKS